MSRFILGNCIDVMRGFPDRAVDLIVTDPPYLVGFKDRQGRQIAGDVTDEWLQPATLEMYRVLKKDALMVSFYGWNRVDRFMAAWKAAGFYAVGQLVFTKTYAPTVVMRKTDADSWTTAMKGLMSLPKAARCRPSNRCRM
jgi:site-specific DNA-methyltransferase (adenine-specific)